MSKTLSALVALCIAAMFPGAAAAQGTDTNAAICKCEGDRCWAQSAIILAQERLKLKNCTELQSGSGVVVPRVDIDNERREVVLAVDGRNLDGRNSTVCRVDLKGLRDNFENSVVTVWLKLGRKASEQSSVEDRCPLPPQIPTMYRIVVGCGLGTEPVPYIAGQCYFRSPNKK